MIETKEDVLSITPAQIRGARGMLDWSMPDLAKAAEVSIATVKRVQDGEAEATSLATLEKIRGALEAAGLEFLADEGNGSGMRLRPRPREVFSRFI